MGGRRYNILGTCTLPTLCKEHNTYPFPTPTALLYVLYCTRTLLHHFITSSPTYCTYITLITAFLSFNFF